MSRGLYLLIRVGSVVAFGVWAMACSSESSPDSAGELLLSISGDVQRDSDRDTTGLSPALGFRAGGHAIDLVDVPVHGSFPGAFRVDIYESPPSAALAKVSRQASGEPRAALAYLTAVGNDHPATIYVADEVRVTAFGCKYVGRADNLCLETRSEWCLVGQTDVPCYVENVFCPADWTSKDQCLIESQGDRALAADDIGEYFAGFSQNHQIVYLEEPAPKGSVTATWFGEPNGIPAGYGLYEVRRLSVEEQTEARECFEAGGGFELTAELFNQAHGTSYASVRCEKNSAMPFCAKERNADRDEVDRLLELSHVQLGCPFGNVEYKPVRDPAHARISVVIDPEQPLTF